MSGPSLRANFSFVSLLEGYAQYRAPDTCSSKEWPSDSRSKAWLCIVLPCFKLTQTTECYEAAIKCPKDHYNRPRVIHHQHLGSIHQALIMKANNGGELHKLYDVCKQYIRAIKLSDHYDLNTFLTIRQHASEHRYYSLTKEKLQIT